MKSKVLTILQRVHILTNVVTAILLPFTLNRIYILVLKYGKYDKMTWYYYLIFILYIISSL